MLIDAVKTGNNLSANILFSEWLNQKRSNSTILRSFTINSLDLLHRNQQILDVVLQRLYFTGWLMAMFSFTLVCLLIWYLRNIITLPVKQLAHAAQKISQEKFDQATITYQSNDELGQLANSIREMSNQLQKSYRLLNKEVKSKTRELLLQHRLEKQKDDFIAIASHELRTPITSQKAFIQMLERELKKNQDVKYLPIVSKISNQTSKIIKLITDLLDVSKMNIGKFEISKRKFDFNQMVKKVVEDIHQMRPKHKILIKGKALSLVEADQSRIQQVLSNIILNGIKYSPNADTIVVEVKQEPNRIITSVKDFGIGIEKKYVKKIFERFYRIKPERVHAVTGMGIGLNISAEIIKLHNGDIWVESEPEKGSTFYFSLPLSV